MGKVIKKFRFLTIDQIEEEQQFLAEMSAQGLHLVGYKFPFYRFEQGDQIEYQYQTDFQKLDGDSKDSYLQLFRDDGWELVMEYPGLDGVWYYFRKQRTNDQNLEIFTDVHSRIELYQKIRRSWFIFFLMISPGILLPVIAVRKQIAVLLLFGVWLLLAVLYGKMTLGLTFKINKLRQRDR